MTNTKYELLEKDTVKSWDGRTLKRIRALVAITTFGVQSGDLGGYIETEANLQVSGNAWVSGNAQVYGNAWVSGNARVYGNAWVSGNARVYGNAQVSGNAQVYGDAWVFGDAWVSGNAQVYGDAQVYLRLHVGWFSNVGSDNGTLTWWRDKKEIYVNRGCFSGTLVEFAEAVDRRHDDSKNGKEYRCLIDFIRLRSADFTWNEGEG